MNKKNIYGKAKNQFYKIAEHSLENVWDYELELSKEVDFVKQGGGNYKLDENEVFFIQTQDEDLQDYLNHMTNTNSCNSITKNALKNLETLYLFETKANKIHLYIQRIMPAARIEKTYLSWKPDIKLAHIETKLNVIIKNNTDIYWNQEKQKIYFYKFVDLERVFPNFSKYYREATKEDIQIFKDKQKYPFLQVNIENFENIPKTKLKTIAMIVDELERVKENLDDYKGYANKYKENFIKNGRFEINDTKDIEHLADIVFRKIYTTEAGDKEIRRANSFKVLEQ